MVSVKLISSPVSGLGLSTVWLNSKSAEVGITELMLAVVIKELSLGSISASLLITSVVVMRFPAPKGLTVKLTVALSPLSRLSKLAVTVFPEIFTGLKLVSERIKPEVMKVPGLDELNPLSVAVEIVLFGSDNTP